MKYKNQVIAWWTSKAWGDQREIFWKGRVCVVCVCDGCPCVREKEEKNVKIDLLNIYSIFNVKIIWKVVVYSTHHNFWLMVTLHVDN